MAQALFRVVAIFFREFQKDNISLRAGALTFTIVLSLVPTLALGTAVLKGLGAGDQMRQAAYKFIDSMEVQPLEMSPTPERVEPLPNQETSVPVPEEFASVDGASDSESLSQDTALTDHLRRAADQIFDYVDRTDFRTLGAFGILGLVFSVLSVLGSIEQSMNVIWQAKSGRPLGRKIMDYLALMILLPLSVNLALATETTLQNKKLFQMLSDQLPIAWITAFMLKILPMVLVIATFTILYRFLPNTKVRLFPALAAGMIGGVSWLFTQTLYLKLQIGVARYNAIYGSFATLPLFLVWLYLGWLVFLAGAEVAFACQVWRSYSKEMKRMLPRATFSLALQVLERLYSCFRQRKMEDLPDIADKLEARVDQVHGVLVSLTEAGLVHHVNDEKKIGYVPAIPQNQLKLNEVLTSIFGPAKEDEHTLVTEIFAVAQDYAQAAVIVSPTEE